MTDNKKPKTVDEVYEEWYSVDNLVIPDVDIEYQEDDGNSECEDGACKI